LPFMAGPIWPHITPCGYITTYTIYQLCTE